MVSFHSNLIGENCAILPLIPNTHYYDSWCINKETNQNKYNNHMKENCIILINNVSLNSILADEMLIVQLFAGMSTLVSCPSQAMLEATCNVH